jgi:hypothetical protein
MANLELIESTCGLPILSRFALSDSELSALARQGFISSENRGGRKTIRLRYRVGNRQHVRYVRPSEVLALEAELASLQKRTRARRRRKRLATIIRRALRLRRLGHKAPSKALLSALVKSEQRFLSHDK